MVTTVLKPTHILSPDPLLSFIGCDHSLGCSKPGGVLPITNDGVRQRWPSRYFKAWRFSGLLGLLKATLASAGQCMRTTEVEYLGPQRQHTHWLIFRDTHGCHAHSGVSEAHNTVRHSGFSEARNTNISCHALSDIDDITIIKFLTQLLNMLQPDRTGMAMQLANKQIAGTVYEREVPGDNSPSEMVISTQGGSRTLLAQRTDDVETEQTLHHLV